jgi:SAM-dependent methyltransferase
MLTGWWRTWRSKAALVIAFKRNSRGRYFEHAVQYPELTAGPDPQPRELRPYDGLAELWDEYAGMNQPDYASYLRHLAGVRRLKLRSVLELACGTGLQTARLAGVAGEVVGLDASEAMLARARGRCAHLPGVRLAWGDFRAFDLGCSFDAVVCSFNSLNYLSDIGELGRVLRAVEAHLRPGGVFVFDTYTDCGMRILSGRYLHLRANGCRFAIHFRYDPVRRSETATVRLPGGVETHRRVPIGPADVAAAARGSGLHVADYFTSPLLPGRWYTGPYCFFTLSRAA